MAPSPERDQDVRTTNETPSAPKENPFIKFRQFADSHIGTLLQGIIGLPSALKNTSGNTRWADFDDDLRRRDEQQAKQRQLKDEVMRDQEQAGEDQGTNAAIQTHEATKAYWENESMSEYFPHNVRDGKDIPLFSPVTKALFNHLNTGDSASNWGTNPLATLVAAFRPDYLPFQLLQTQKPAGHMEALQFMAYNELNRLNVLRSDYSLLPYLLFSPYSPIRLKYEEEYNSSKRREPFPYEAAFQDLIRATEESHHEGTPYVDVLTQLKSQDQPTDKKLDRDDMHLSNRWEQLPKNSKFSPYDVFQHFGAPSVGWMAWIHNLYGEGLLQQREVREVPDELRPFLTGKILELPFTRAYKYTRHTRGDDEHKDEDTELDMYKKFLSWASTPGGIVGALDWASTPTGIANALEELCTNPEGFLEKQLKVLESPDAKKVVEDLLESKFAKEVKDLVDMLEGFERQDLQSEKASTTVSKEIQDPAKVVSSSTTTEHTTHEDGSVETCVTVWKRYADGRESVTTTNHVDNPACDENGNQIASSSNNNEAVPEDEKKPENKGWFWN